MQIDFEVQGTVGELGGDVATALSLVIAELLQNAVEHAFPAQVAREASIRLSFEHPDDGELQVSVVDNGIGFGPDFDLDRTRSLGLAIVRDLVRSQLNGTITIGGELGAAVVVTVPMRTADTSGR